MNISLTMSCAGFRRFRHPFLRLVEIETGKDYLGKVKVFYLHKSENGDAIIRTVEIHLRWSIELVQRQKEIDGKMYLIYEPIPNSKDKGVIIILDRPVLTQLDGQSTSLMDQSFKLTIYNTAEMMIAAGLIEAKYRKTSR